MSETELQAELTKLRAELEAYRQHELDTLRTQLAAAQADAQHYRQEAYAVLANFRELEAVDREKIARLETEIQTMRMVNRNGTRTRAGAGS